RETPPEPTVAPSETTIESPTIEPTLTPETVTITSTPSTATPTTPDDESTETIPETPFPTPPDEWPPDPVLAGLITDTFDSGDLSNWSFKEAGWALITHDAGQALHIFNTHAHARLIHTDRLNMAVEIAVLLDHGDARLSVRHSAAGSYTVTLKASGNVNLYRANELMASAQVAPSAPGQWRTLRLSAIQDVLLVRVDGIEVIAIRDD